MHLCFTVEFSPSDAALGTCGSRLGIHLNALHRRQVDHQTIIDAGEPSHIVSAAAYSDLKTLLAAEINGVDDVSWSGATRDYCGMFINQTIVHTSCLVIARICLM